MEIENTPVDSLFVLRHRAVSFIRAAEDGEESVLPILMFSSAPVGSDGETDENAEEVRHGFVLSKGDLIDLRNAINEVLDDYDNISHDAEDALLEGDDLINDVVEENEDE